VRTPRTTFIGAFVVLLTFIVTFFFSDVRLSRFCLRTRRLQTWLYSYPQSRKSGIVRLGYLGPHHIPLLRDDLSQKGRFLKSKLTAGGVQPGPVLLESDSP